MCGIAGLISPAGLDPQMLIAMTHLAKHRGPSGFGFAFYEKGPLAAPQIIHGENRQPPTGNYSVGLGNRRLAILDLSSMGNMPMQIENGAYCVTYNGELYNYKEIRADLEALGYSFKTGTDTEVLLRSYQEWGEECLSRFNGMWSFALWDRRRQSLFCARDRFGVKPFYYALHEGRFYFASEIKQLTHGAGLPRVANPRSVYHFLEHGLMDYSSDTFFENIHQLPGGFSLRLNLSSPLAPVITMYWELALKSQNQMTEGEATEEFRMRFENAVRLRLRSDVPIGASLSGGLDSSAIICEAKRLEPEKEFYTFSACFHEAKINESHFARSVVNRIQAKHYEAYPTNHSFWDEVESLLFYQDEPIASASVYAQWCVMAEAKKQGVPVLLGGQGGDEALCGYQKYRYFYLWELLKQGNPSFFRESLMSVQNGTRSSWAWSDASRYFPGPLRRRYSVVDRLCSPEFRESFEDPTLHLGARDTLAERQKVDLTFSSLPALLHFEDRNSMAHSIESRLPFLDYKLVELAVNCPSFLKFRNGWSKWMLREAMTGTLPEMVRLRKSKLGFDIPQESWMHRGLSNGRRNLWETRHLWMERFVAPKKLVSEMQKFLSNNRGSLPPYFLFRAISLELWAQVHQVS